MLICIENVGINPTRIGFLEVLKEMNANIKIENVREANNEQIGDIYVKYSPLKSVIVAKDIIPNIIDELPLLSFWLVLPRVRQKFLVQKN